MNRSSSTGVYWSDMPSLNSDSSSSKVEGKPRDSRREERAWREGAVAEKEEERMGMAWVDGLRCEAELKRQGEAGGRARDGETEER